MRLLFVFTTIIFVFLSIQPGISQSHFPGLYMVSFPDKLSAPTDSFKCLSSKAIERRLKNQIEIDTLDFPVNPYYIDSIRNLGFEVKHISRWTNSALVQINDSSSWLVLCQNSFVKSTLYLAPVSEKIANYKKFTDELETFSLFPKDHGAANNQLDLIGITPIHSIERKGDGIVVVVLDAGFNNVDQMDAFKKLRGEGGLLGTKDFVNPANNVYNESTHGTYVLSTMAAYIEGKYIGSGPEAEYFLLRTEDVSSEFPVEEYYWLVAAEFADSMGADIITSSLSYTTFDDESLNHYHEMADGLKAIISKAATIAASKGIIVFQSAGNDGDNQWRKIGFPADAVDIITVGAVDSLGKYATLSSVGNTSDGRIKPELMSVGFQTALVNTNDKVFYGNGTSFSTPMLAGATACLMQLYPAMNYKDIRKLVLENASRYENPDSMYGYGIPNFYLTALSISKFEIPEIDSQKMFVTLPNPFSNGFYLLFDAENYLSIEVRLNDMNGKIVKSKKVNNIKPGVNTVFIGELENLGHGVYTVSLSAGDKIYSRKIVK